jgi:hypothetical protein
LVSADKGYTPLNLSDNIISDIVKPNILDTIATFTGVCKLLAKNKNTITGDFNIDTNKDNAKKNSFIDLLNSYVLHLNVKNNTRVCSTSS